ncbi:MAG: transcription antitermination factor NusB [Clostridia bacterium]|nr:transcription antitermination factor NusB [Clostridia bacterium]
MGRKLARDIFFKLIFENLFVESKESVTYENFLQGTGLDLEGTVVTIDSLDEENLQFLKDNYLSYLKNKEQIFEVLSKNIKGYTIESMFKIDLAILVAAIQELMFYKQTPIKIVVNEAVELAKKYSTDKSSSFINGILANVVKGVENN